MKILLQFPEGLKEKAQKWVKKLESEGHEVYLSARPTYGACDIAVEEAKALKVDKIIHFGHVLFPVGKVKDIEVEFIVERKELTGEDIQKIKNELKKENIKEIALTSTVEFTPSLKKLKKELEKEGIKALIKKGTLAIEEGQILGCDGKPADISNNVLFIGNGFFHPFAIKYKEGKKIFNYNPFSKTFTDITEKIKRKEKRKRGAIAKAYSASSFGILVSTKNGQFQLLTAKSIKKRLEKFGKNAYIIVGNELNPLSITNYRFIDAFITTACPRIVDDEELYEKPILDLEMTNELLKLYESKEENNKHNEKDKKS